jgi:LysR family transcriptional regulator, regulator for bpeEF and oprC
MDRLQAMQVFTKVVQMNSFSRAADAMGLPRPAVSAVIKNLESHLQVSLMHRTTRRLSVTPEGAHYYEVCVRILSDIRECEQALSSPEDNPQGRLRIDMPGSVARIIVAPRIMEFREKYPDVDLAIGSFERPAIFAKEKIDCYIRSCDVPEPGFIRRPLGGVELVAAASPEYLAHRPCLIRLEDLQGHLAVQYYASASGRVVPLNFIVDDIPREIVMDASLTLSDIETYVTCGIMGAGIIQAPRFLLQEHLDRGRLVEVLPNWKPAPFMLSALYPSNQHLTAKVRVFVEWIAEVFDSCKALRSTQRKADIGPQAQSVADIASSL